MPPPTPTPAALPAHSRAEHLARYKVLSAGVASLILSLGIARFAYTPMLPLLQAQAGLGVAEAGWLAALNYVGYLCGALLAASINDLVLKDRLYRLGMLIAIITTIVMGLSTDITVWIVSRFFAGLSSASGILLGSGLILNWLIRHHHRPELGIHFAGTGLGIAVCSVIVAGTTGHFAWDMQWYVLAGVGALLAIPALAWLPPPDTSTLTKIGQPMHDQPPSPLFMRLFMLAYFCTGMGYVISATFIVAIVEHLPGMSGHGTQVFLVLGLAAAPACVVWDLIARRIRELNALILAALLQIVGILLPLAGGLTAAMLGAALFGGTFIGMVSLVLTMAGRYYPTRPAKMMGQLTIAYGIAQIIGPAITGNLAQSFGSYNAGLYMAAAVMLVGTALYFALKTVERRAM